MKALFESVACDWLSGRHDYPGGYSVAPRNGGFVMKVTSEGEIEWESPSWEHVRCPSSDTSIRIKCDGAHLWFSGNIGRFQRGSNLHGLTVIQCVERWSEVMRSLGFDLRGFGTRWNPRQITEWGTHLTRIDLAGNFDTDNYGSVVQASMIRRIGQKLPQLGKYGPTWGYDSKRSNWWKAKIYDKSAELAGKRRSEGGATTARFEVQLGSEYLKRENLDQVIGWKGTDMAQVIFGRFADQVFRESIDVQRWADLPPKLQHWATCWREGRDLRSDMSQTTYYRIRSKLLEYGIDIGAPCNVLALTRRVQVVTVTPVSALLDDLRVA